MRRSRRRHPFQHCPWVWQAGLLLVVAFLIHDGYMAVEGHVMAGAVPDDHAGMTVDHEERAEHVALATAIDTLGLVAIGSTPAPEGTPICPTERPAVMINQDDASHIESGIERPTFIPSPDVDNALQSVLTINLGRDLPPSRAPDAQRAMFQVYRI